MKQHLQRTLLAIVALLPFAISSCRSKTIAGADTTYRYALWFLLIALLAGLAVGVIGYFVYRSKHSWLTTIIGILLMITAPLYWFITYAALAHEYVTINLERVEFGTGFGHTPKVVQFADCQRLEFRTEQYGIKPSSKATDAYLVLKNGTEVKLTATIIRGDALDELISRLMKGRIPVVGDRRGL